MGRKEVGQAQFQLVRSTQALDIFNASQFGAESSWQFVFEERNAGRIKVILWTRFVVYQETRRYYIALERRGE